MFVLTSFQSTHSKTCECSADQCDDMTSDEWTKLHRKKATVLLILDRHTINAEELRMKIMGEIFFPSDWASVRSWLTEKGLSWEDKPIFFDGEYLMKFGVKIKQWEDEPDMVRCERAWLRQACHLLDITYEEKIEGYEYGTKSIVIDIPRGWDFNPKRQVSMMDICPSCKRMAPYEEMRYILRHGESLCSSCVRPLSCPGDRLESESIDQADSDFEYEDEDTHDSSSSLSYGSLSEKPCADEENDYESDEEFQWGQSNRI